MLQSMAPVRGFAISAVAACIAVAACFVLIAWMAPKETTTRLAFDNRGYPEELLVQLWIDGAGEGAVLSAHCTPDHCETAPMMMREGRHKIRLQVIVNNGVSSIVETTVER